MDFAHRQAALGRRYASLGIVVTLHLVLGWAVVIGLTRHMPDELAQAPIQIKLVKPETPPPPPPQRNLLPRPSVAPPPLPRFIPPPEFEVTQPPETTVAASPTPQSMAGSGTDTATPQKGGGRSGNGPPSTPPQLDFTKCRPPAYPDFDVEGTTMVVFTMDVDGTISDAGIGESSGPSSRHKLLDRLALKFVQSCRGTPGTVNGKPVPLRGVTPIRWNLKD